MSQEVAVEEPEAEVESPDAVDEAAPDPEPANEDVVEAVPADVAPEEAPAEVPTDNSDASDVTEEAVPEAVVEAPASLARVTILGDQFTQEPGPVDAATLAVGNTLWVRAYDADGSRVSPDTQDLSFRWLAADEPSTDVNDYTEVVGCEEYLTLTAELAGRSVIVEVRRGGEPCVYGPLSENDAPRLAPVVLPAWPTESEAVATEADAGSDDVDEGVAAEAVAEEADAAVNTEPQTEAAPAENATELSAQSVTAARTPTSDIKPAWSARTRPTVVSEDSISAQVSEPLVVHGRLVVFSGTDALVLSPITGEVVARRDGLLPVGIATPCEPLLSDDVIYVPLCNGSVVALDAHSGWSRLFGRNFLTALWTSEPLVDGTDASCTLSTAWYGLREYLVVGVSADGAAGALVTLDLRTGKQVAGLQEPTSGFGDVAPLMSLGIAYVGDSSGVLHAINVRTGKEISSITLSTSPICGRVVAYGTSVLAMDRDGVLHKVGQRLDSKLVELGSVRIGKGSMSAPMVAGSQAVCAACGPVGDEASEGSLVVVNLDSMKVARRVTQADGKPLAKGGVTSEPLVSVRLRGTWCYFVTSGSKDTVYAYRLGDEHAQKLYVAAGMKTGEDSHPLMTDDEGSIYYLSVDGLLTKLVAGQNAGDDPHEGGDKPDPQPGGDKPDPQDGKEDPKPTDPTKPSDQDGDDVPPDVQQDDPGEGPSGQGGGAATGVRPDARRFGQTEAPEGAELDAAEAAVAGPADGSEPEAGAAPGAAEEIADDETPLASGHRGAPLNGVAQVIAQPVPPLLINGSPSELAAKAAAAVALTALAYFVLRRPNGSLK